MKKMFVFMFLFSIFLCVNAQEPGNNLGKSIASIQQSFPNLIFLRTENGYKIYKSNGEGNDTLQVSTLVMEGWSGNIPTSLITRVDT